jgi:hypothetical protein
MWVSFSLSYRTLGPQTIPVQILKKSAPRGIYPQVFQTIEFKYGEVMELEEIQNKHVRHF